MSQFRIIGKYVLLAALIGTISELVDVFENDETFYVLDAAVIGVSVVAVGTIIGAAVSAIWPENKERDSHADS
jgi:hypothetical protein